MTMLHTRSRGSQHSFLHYESEVELRPIKNTSQPLFVDLDGTLVKADIFLEAIFALVRKNPCILANIIGWLIRGGRARVKYEIAVRYDLQACNLPYNEELLDFLREQKTLGRKIHLATASNEIFAKKVADKLGLFDAVLASDARENLKGGNKLERILNYCEGEAFSYAGDAFSDVKIWSSAETAIIVNPSWGVLKAAKKVVQVEKIITDGKSEVLTLLSALRLHQWVKNLLVAVPLLTAHAFSVESFGHVLSAFFSFCLLASATYLLNDLFDLQSDRAHPRKQKRPIAAGELKAADGLFLAFFLIAISFLIAWGLPTEFVAALFIYLVLTLCYSMVLKTFALIDVMVLASLYALRIIAGAAAIQVELSFWLISFSMFFFLSLALVKRYAEVRSVEDTTERGVSRRDYRVQDEPLLTSMGISSGFLSILVLALFIEHQHSLEIYSNPAVLWMLCPPLLYWILRMWIKTARDDMHDDPIVFSVRDIVSWLVLTFMIVTVYAAI